MKTECTRALMDMILDPAESGEAQLKLELQERGIDAERWQRKVLCYLRQKKKEITAKPGRRVERKEKRTVKRKK